MSDQAVRYIHTQQQAQAELERQRLMARARSARGRQLVDADPLTSQRRKQNGV